MSDLAPSIVRAVLEDPDSAPISRPQRSALHLLETMTRCPGEITASFVTALRTDGLTAEAIEDAANVGFHVNLMNRLAEAFDFPLPDATRQPRMTRALQLLGRYAGGRRPAPSFTRSSDGLLRPVEVDRGRARLLSAPGVTDPSLRRAIEGYTARLRGARRGADDVPAVLRPYLEKLARHPYRITDDDLAALRAAGYGDEAVYELTLTGAFGAAVVGLERAFEGLYGNGG